MRKQSSRIYININLLEGRALARNLLVCVEDGDECSCWKGKFRVSARPEGPLFMLGYFDVRPNEERWVAFSA